MKLGEFAVKTLLLTTALLGASTLGASAQDLFRGEASPDEIRASDLIGMRVYASEAATDATEYEGLQEGWEDIGEVNDLVLGRDGSVQAALVDVGGFLGVGERQVAVSMSALRFVSDSATAEDASDYFLVINASRANLEEAPDYMGDAADAGMTAEGAANATAAGAAAGTVAAGTAAAAAGATDAATETEMAADDTAAAATDAAASDAAATTDTATTDVATTDATATDAARTPLSREGYVAVGADMMTADALQGAAVYDSTDERVGEVGELLIDDAGQVTDVVLDVGGFLGIGEKTVSLPMSSLDVLQQEGGDDLRVYVSQTREALEGMETYTAE